MSWWIFKRLLKVDDFGNVMPVAGHVMNTPATNQTSTGLIMQRTLGETVVFGNVLYLKSDGRLWKANATDGTKCPAVAMALEAGNAADVKKVCMWGPVRNDSWTWVVGSGEANLLFLSAAADGAIVTAAPSGTPGFRVQIVARVIDSTSLFFFPTPVMVQLAS